MASDCLGVTSECPLSASECLLMAQVVLLERLASGPLTSDDL